MHEPEVQFIHVDEPHKEPTEVTVTTTPDTEMFVYNPESSSVDMLTKAKQHLTRLKAFRRIVKLQRKKAAKAPMLARRVARNRNKNKAAKASRKRNR